MNIFIFLLLGTIVAAIDQKLAGGPWRWSTRLANWVYDVLFVNLVTLVIFRFGFGQATILEMLNQVQPLTFGYIGGVLLVGALLLLAKALNRRYQWFVPNTAPVSKWRLALRTLVTIGFIVGAFFYFASMWFVDTFGHLTAEQLVFTLRASSADSETSVMGDIFNTPVLALAASTLAFVTLYWQKRDWFRQMGSRLVLSNQAMKRIMVVGAGLTLFGGLYTSFQTLQIGEIYRSLYVKSDYVQDNYADPDKTKLTFPKQKRNVIHIYLESVENSFFDRQSGGYMAQDLMPELKKLAEQPGAVSFTNSKDPKIYGGPHQTHGSSWSVASMVNMSMGLPLKVSASQNSYGKEGSFLPGATGIGDILAREGYNQEIMFGANADFGGLTTFFTTHGKYKIFDYKHAKDQGYIPNDYKVWWGYEDKKLYQFAQQEITRLSQAGKPFNFTMENADTHFPNGYQEPGRAQPFEQPYANAIFHSQEDVAKFVKWIQAQPFYDDTMIVLTGDHLSMDKHFFKDFDPSYHRTTFNLILNGDFNKDQLKLVDRQYAPFDYFPTVLAGMGVKIDGNRLGMGTNLASNEKTLIERDGLDHVNGELSQLSDYYEDHFVSTKDHPERTMPTIKELQKARKQQAK